MRLKRKVIIFMVILSLGLPLLSQDGNTDTVKVDINKLKPFYDAQELSGYIKDYNPGDTAKAEKIIAILNAYIAVNQDKKFEKKNLIQLNQTTLKLKINEIKELFNTGGKYENPYIYDVISNLSYSPGVRQNIKDEIEKNFGKDETEASGTRDSKFGGLGAGILGPAISKLIASRLKYGLVESVLLRIRKVINEKEMYKELFPLTVRKINLVIPEKYDELDLTLIFNEMKEAFSEDLKYLKTSLPTFLSGRLPASKGEIQLILTTFNMIDAINKNQHPLTFINSLRTNLQYTNIQDGNINNILNSIKLASILSGNLMNDADSDWIAVNKLKNAFKVEMVRKLFIGLLIEKERKDLTNIEFIKGATQKNLIGVLIENKPKLENGQDMIAGFVKKANKLSALVKDYNNKNNGEEEKKKFVKIMEIAGEALGMLIDFNGLFKEINQIDGNKLVLYRSLVKNATGFFNGLYSRDYAGALYSAFNILETLENQGIIAKLGENFRKYVLLLYNVMQADDYNQVYKLLVAHAKPYSSFMEKRRRDCDLSLNAYPGFLLGRDKYIYRNESLDTEEKEPWGSLTASFTAPVGLAASTRIGKNGGALSLFFPVIDVGALTSLFLSNADSDVPQLGWKDMWAPGAYLIYGLRNSPISIGFGGQYGPVVRKIDIDENNEFIIQKTKSYRIGFLIAFDITIF